MEKIIERLVNYWYKDWILENDPYTAFPDFEMLLEERLPEFKFIQANGDWVIIKAY